MKPKTFVPTRANSIWTKALQELKEAQTEVRAIKSRLSHESNEEEIAWLERDLELALQTLDARTLRVQALRGALGGKQSWEDYK